jgi:hypothetical protein
MMTKSEKISEMFNKALAHIDLAEAIIHRIHVITGYEIGEPLNVKFGELMELIEESQYDICMPLEMAEEEREQEIELLEKRLAELKAQ